MKECRQLTNVQCGCGLGWLGRCVPRQPRRWRAAPWAIVDAACIVRFTFRALQMALCSSPYPPFASVVVFCLACCLASLVACNNRHNAATAITTNKSLPTTVTHLNKCPKEERRRENEQIRRTC